MELGMNVIYQEKAKERKTDLSLLQHASRVLEEVIGRSADRITAEWDRTEDPKGRLLYTLDLRDGSSQIQAYFSPEELTSPAYMRVRLYRVWGDLLQVRSDEQHRRVQQLVDQQEGG
jgi:hypothetical protein